jgi:putative hemolysin
MRTSLAALTLTTITFLLLACTPRIILGPTGNPGTGPSPAPSAGIANPASVFCTENGGSLQIRRGLSGEAGYCVFSNISECEEWAFYRGQCKPGDNPYKP